VANGTAHHRGGAIVAVVLIIAVAQAATRTASFVTRTAGRTFDLIVQAGALGFVCFKSKPT
jgi:hypothetical protein